MRDWKPFARSILINRQRPRFLQDTVCAMHKVLFIAYDFPPCPSIGGSLRSEHFVKYLPEFGWKTTVLAFSKYNHVVKEKYSDVNRVSSLTPWARPLEATPYGWIPPLYRYGRRIMRENRYDLIYVSCPPFPQTMTALWLKRLAGVPLVVDFRDAWTLAPYMETTLVKKVINRTLFPFMEKMVLRNTDWLIVNTPSALRAYLNNFPSVKDRISMIPNGYEEEDFSGYRPSISGNQMILLYCGRFGCSERDPTNLLEAVKLLVEEHLPIRLRIIGPRWPGLSKLAATPKLGNNVQYMGQLPHNEAVHCMADCDVLVLYQGQSHVQITPIAGKTYEYLRAGKAVLAVAPPGDNLDIIRKFAFRCETSSPQDAYGIAQAIRSLYHDWERGKLASYVSPPKDFEQYNRQALANRLASLFDQLIIQKKISDS